MLQEHDQKSLDRNGHSGGGTPLVVGDLRPGGMNLQLAGMRSGHRLGHIGTMESRVKPLRCVIVDDYAEFLDAAAKLLEGQGVAVVGVASGSAEALRRVEELRPDVILVDVDLGDESGFELAEQLQQNRHPDPPRVILISTHDAQDFADVIAASPAVGYLSKSDLSLRAIQEILGG